MTSEWDKARLRALQIEILTRKLEQVTDWADDDCASNTELAGWDRLRRYLQKQIELLEQGIQRDIEQ